MVRGYQGNDLAQNTTLMATVKHFALYGAAEGGRDYNTVDMSRIRMYNEYFPPYKAAIEAGVGSVMTSFNEIDGIPATGNRWLLTDVLRDQWGFDGFVVTDYTAVNEMTNHGMGDLQTVSTMALKAGSDMDMVGEGFLSTLKKSLDEGKVTQPEIDRAVRRILEAKYKLGLFDDPYRYLDEARAGAEVFSPANRATVRNIAAQTMVLMENADGLLPLKKEGAVALVGPLADAAVNMTGTWSVTAVHANAVSLRQALDAMDQIELLYAKGSNLTYDADLEANSTLFGKSLDRDDRPADALRDEAVGMAEQADVIVAALGEAAEMSGESSSRTDITIPQVQKDLLDALIQTGKPVVLVLFTGRPLVLTEEKAKLSTILNVWFPGSEAGAAISDVLFGDVNPSGKLPMTFPRSVGQIPIYYNHKNTGRPIGNTEGRFEKFRSNYLDERNEPLYPFGYGLSYTTFAYSDMILSAEQLQGNQTLKASITLTNTGGHDGAEVVQLYIRDKVGRVTRPVKELKGFQKVFLNAGASQEVSFDITPDLLKFYDAELNYDWESGAFEIMIGTDASNVQSKTVNWEK
jgi:beta-glucosidase